MELLSNSIIPILVLLIIIYGIYKKLDIFDIFVDGSKESIPIILSMFGPILAMIFAINIFVNSGVLTFILELIFDIFNISFSKELVPMFLMRPVSGSATLAILNNIYNTYGPDSFNGLLASIVQGATDTTLYVLTLYFGSIGIKKIKHALWAGLFADFVGIISSILIAIYFFG